MEQILKTILQSQKLKDIGAVIRGADRVCSSVFQQFRRTPYNPFISTEARGPSYYYDHSANEQGLDAHKRFDYAENQPRFDKDQEAKIYQNPQMSANTSKGLQSSSKNYNGLNKPFGNSFSTTARSSQDNIRIKKTMIASSKQPQESIEENENMDSHVQRTMKDAKDKSLSDYQQETGGNEDPSRNILPKKIEKVVRKNLRERKVPASTFARTATFAGLGLNLAASAVGGVVKNIITGEKTSISDAVLTEENGKRISETFSRMRGIPLKLGQVLSMQEENLIPKVITQALETAQKSADIMPRTQLFEVMARELGENWQDKFQKFDMQPIAAASIGQVHKARTKEGIKVAVKVQYPGVAESIDTDINSVKRLLVYPGILPRSLFMDDILAHIRKELLEECDYVTEANKQMEFREKISQFEGFYVPKVISELSTKHVLTQEFILGTNLDECTNILNQEQRNKLGEKIFELLLVQLFDIGYMQTDPNPANFFYVPETNTINLIDFGAAQQFTPDFVKNYMDIIYGAATRNGKLVYKGSKDVGFITGEENRELLDAHVSSVLIIGEPFATEGPFDFGNSDVTKRIYEKLPVLVEQRLKPPPQVVYSLHRMLTGGYLICMKLGSVVHVSKLFKEARERYISRGNKTL